MCVCVCVSVLDVYSYISICHPFQRERFCTTRRAVIVIIGLILGTLSLNAVQGYFWHYYPELKDCSLRKEVIEYVFDTWSYVTEGAVFIVVPIFIFCLNILVIVSAKKLEANEKSLLGNTHNSQRSES